MHRVGAQDKVVIMRDSRAEYELCVGLGRKFNRGARRPEGHQLALLQFVRNENGAHPDGGLEDSVLGGRLVAPAFSSFQTHREVIHRRWGFDRTCRGSIATQEDMRGPIVRNDLRRQIDTFRRPQLEFGR